VDTSKSMLAQDVKPNRLERAKLAIKDFIKHLQGDRIGLIAFSGEAFLQCPLTVDYNGFLLSLDSLSVNSITRGGTSISQAIKEAIKSYEGGFKKYKVLIMITDGEDHEGAPLKAAEDAKKEGIKIFCIGIGTPEGELISVEDEKGNKTFLKDSQGNVVKTRLDETTLQKIALATGGSYVRSGATEFGLDMIYDKKLSKMEKRELESKLAKQFEDRFQIPLALAFLLLAGELFINERKRCLRMNGEALCLVFISIMLFAFCPVRSYADSAADSIKKGNQLYEKGNYDEALKHYNEAQVDRPDSDIIPFDKGAALYQKGDYEKAIEEFTKALLSRDPSIEEKSLYNIGNSKYRLGKMKVNTDMALAAGLYREALDYYKRAIELNRENTDAKYNHEFVEKELKILLDKLKNQQQKKQEEKEKNQQQQKKQQQNQEQTRQEQREKQNSESSQQKQKEQEKEQNAEEQSADFAQEKEKEEQKSAESRQPEQVEPSPDLAQNTKKEEQPFDSAPGALKEEEEMSEEEARMILERYGREDLTIDDVNKEWSSGRYPEVLKDW
ncbi:MAG: VWA domain-containing protein, partial [Candidatus Aureabacteria bacterium]|nr:VWA domain-containing protein [Candidatus Auribacterota bacterium]